MASHIGELAYDWDVDPEKLLDTREPETQERWAAEHIRACKPTLLKLIQKSKDVPDPPENSWLGRVDAKTTPFETSQMARLALMVATDNLREVDLVLNKRVPTFALYSMIRSAMESSSLALWILDGKAEDKTASRTLRVYRQNIESDRMLWKTVVGRASGDHDTLLAAAQEKHDALRGVAPESFEFAVKSTDVIQAVDGKRPSQSTNMDVLRGVEVWRACSAVTHGNQISLLNLLERHPDGALGERTTRKSRLSFVASFYSTSLYRTLQLLEAIEDGSKPRRNGKQP